MTTRTHTDLGRALKEARTRAGLTQRDVARHLGMGHTYVAHLEGGTMGYPPSAEYLVQLAALTGADADELCRLAGKLPPDLEQALLGDRELLRTVRALVAGRGEEEKG